jgi:hypothetical protein
VFLDCSSSTNIKKCLSERNKISSLTLYLSLRVWALAISFSVEKVGLGDVSLTWGSAHHFLFSLPLAALLLRGSLLPLSGSRSTIGMLIIIVFFVLLRFFSFTFVRWLGREEKQLVWSVLVPRLIFAFFIMS